VLDLCAAPGGKTSQLAAAGASVTAVERHPGRAAALRATMERVGARVEVVEADAREFAQGVYDRILLDAPCSGNGVLAGRPDARWRRTPEDVAVLAALQAELIAHALTLRAPGGRLVYSVCTLTPAENEEAVTAAGARALEELRTWPDERGGDGFYVAEIELCATGES
jgi:16S rRNA (cytosine967-C5)-methyltransferase